MRGFIVSIAAVVLFASCSSVITTTVLSEKQGRRAGGVRFRFFGDVAFAFRTRLMIRCVSSFKSGLYPVMHGEDYIVEVRLDPVQRDFTPIFFIVPPLLSYLGCPQGSVSRRYSLRVISAADGRILVIWKGKVRRPFGLYYMIASAERRMHDEILIKSSSVLNLFFQRQL